MCNQYGNTIATRDYYDELSLWGLKLVSPARHAAPNLQPRPFIRPTDSAPILRTVDGGVELKEMRWGLIPHFHKARVKDWKILGTNARSETASKTAMFKNAWQHNRCLVPASEFYEWSGEKGHKTKWRFRSKGNEWFCMAGLWEKADTAEGTVESFTILTMPAGPDVAPYHDRQPVVLTEEQYIDWLNPNLDARPLFLRPPVGRLEVCKATKLLSNFQCVDFQDHQEKRLAL